MNIYQISEELQKVFHNLDESYDENGEITQEAIDKINSLTCSAQDKCISFASHILNIEADLKAIEDVEKDLKKRKERLAKKSNDMREFLKTNMEKSHLTEVKSPIFDLKIKKNPLSVAINNESLIPNEFKKIKKFISIDKSKIRDEILSGQIVLGAELIQNTRLEIK